MPSVKELYHQRRILIESGREVIQAAEKENRGLTAEDKAKIAKIHQDAATLGEQIALLEKQEDFERQLTDLRPADQPLRRQGPSTVERKIDLPAAEVERLRSMALSAWCAGPSRLTAEHQQAMTRFAIDVHQPILELRLPNMLVMPELGHRIDQVLNALSVGSDTAGGFTVPTTLVQSLEIALLQFAAMRNVATILRTPTGEQMNYPTCNDTSNEGIEVAENAAVDTTGTDVAFGSLAMRAYPYSSRLVRVSFALIRDSVLDIGTLIGRLLGERLGRIQNRRCTTGDGAAKPKGIIPSAAVGKTAAAATALAADELIELIHSIDPAYRGDPSVAFMMHDSIFLAVSLLKDGVGNFLLRPGLEAGSPNTIRGYRVAINQHMDSTLASGKVPVAFGALGKYLIRETGTIRLQRLQERFAELDQIAFHGLWAFDGGLLDAGTRPVKTLTMP